MRTWSLQNGDPLSLRLAADARVSIPDYVDDQIWELRLEGGEPPALALETTFGLRALGMRIFPGFRWRGRQKIDPASFNQAPNVERIYPNFLQISFLPFDDLEVEAEYWMPDSKLVAGRLRLTNVGSRIEDIQIQTHGLLRPQSRGKVMSEQTIEGVKVLAGVTERIAPVLFATGGAEIEQAAFPALTVPQSLKPGDPWELVWALGGYSDHESSFDAARSMGSIAWDAELSRLDLLNQSLVDIQTGDPDWDAAFGLSQKVSLGCYVGPTKRMPAASIVATRLPDKGFSPRGDGSDYGLQWEGQTATQAYVNIQQILPTAPDLAKGVIENFVHVQNLEGVIDWRPGLGGQRTGSMSAPILADLAWKIFEHTGDEAFLRKVFSGIRTFVDLWFDPIHDHDQDGFPEWEHSLQTSFDDCPTFVRWQPWGHGLDIEKVESPDLAAYLFNECTALQKIADVLGVEDATAGFEARKTTLSQALEPSWSDEATMYRYIDRDLHQAIPGELLGSGRGEFTLDVDRLFDPSVRVLVRSTGSEGHTHAAKVFIHGRGRRGRGRVERLTERKFQWFWDLGTATSEKTYAEIERVEVRGLSESFETEIWLADFQRQDQIGLLPLWAGMPPRERAVEMIQETVLDPQRFWRRYGLSSTSAQDVSFAPDNGNGAGGVWMYWNLLIGEALLRYEFVDDAAELVHRLMQAVVGSLRSDQSFREAYNSDTLEGIGERDHVGGVAPLSLFLQTLGVRLISPRKIQLRAYNPYPWPIELRWRGLHIRWKDNKAIVTFPDGGKAEVEGDDLQFVEQLVTRRGAAEDAML